MLEPMRSLWGDLVGISTSASGNVVQLFGRKVYVLGAGHKHIVCIQGAAFEYAYGDEITTWDEGVFQMLKAYFPARTAILMAPVTQIILSIGSSAFWTAVQTSTVRPIPLTTKSHSAAIRLRK